MNKRDKIVLAVAVAVMIIIGVVTMFRGRGTAEPHTTLSVETTESVTELTTESVTELTTASGAELTTESGTTATAESLTTESKADKTESGSSKSGDESKEDKAESGSSKSGDESKADKTGLGNGESGDESKEDETEVDRDSLYGRYSELELKKLSGTKIFTKSAIEHIFKGSNGGGYHYEGIGNTPGEADPDSRTEPDDYGVYTAKVKIDGKNKNGNKGYSSFFPIELSPQEVIDAITEAYNDRELVSGNTYEGVSESGILIDMYLTDDGRIISAFPIYDN